MWLAQCAPNDARPPGQNGTIIAPPRESSRKGRRPRNAEADEGGPSSQRREGEGDSGWARKVADEAAAEVLQLRSQLEFERKKGLEDKRRIEKLLQQLADQQERANDFKALVESAQVEKARLEKIIARAKIEPGLSGILEDEALKSDQEERPFTYERGETDLMMGEASFAAKKDGRNASRMSLLSKQSDIDMMRKEMRNSGYAGTRRPSQYSGVNTVDGEEAELPEMAEEDELWKELAKPCMTDEEHVMILRGVYNCIIPQPHMPGIFPGGAPRGEGTQQQFSWILAMSIPNPRFYTNMRPAGIGTHEAACVFDVCFNAEDTAGNGSMQPERFYVEKALFMRAFAKLPDASDDRPHAFEKHKRFSGEEPEDSSWREAMVEEGLNPDVLAQSFMELLRNCMMTKITMHCQLPARVCATEDEANVMIMVTATPKDLLREADREGFPVELSLRAVDPVSLEPCCPRTFYPLLDWYLKRCPAAPVAGVARAFKKVLQTIKKASPQEQKELAKELEFWNDHAAYSKSASKQVNKTKFKNKQYSFYNNKHVTSVGSRIFRAARGGKMFAASQADAMSVKEEDHTYSSAHKRQKLLDAFIIYLELKAARGLGADPVQLAAEANAKVGAKVLVNWHEALGLEAIASPFKPFKTEFYEGPDARPWVHKSYTTRARNANSFITTPFSGNARPKLLYSIINRQLDIAQLVSLGYLTSIYPLDTRDKIEDAETGEVSELQRKWGLPDEADLLTKAYQFIKCCFMRAPIEPAKEYYGERIAFYFSLLDTVSWWLWIPGFFGIITWSLQQMYKYNPRTDTPTRMRAGVDICFAGMVAVWGTLLLERWKRKQVMTAFQWGQRGISKVEVARPHFHGILRRSPVNYGDNDMFYSRWYRARWQLLSIGVIGTMMALELCFTVLTGRLRSQWIKNQWVFHRVAQQITALIEDFQMVCMTKVGLYVGMRLNDWENQKTGTDYINALIIKVVIHELWNRFNLYVYIAFWKARAEGCVVHEDGLVTTRTTEEMNGKMCLDEVTTQVTTVLIVEFFKNGLELFKPLLAQRWITWWLPAPTKIAVSREHGLARMAHICQEAMEKPLYGPSLEVDGTFADYLELMVLMGHFTLFSLVFPLAPTLGCILLAAEIRVDGFKIFELVRRPLPRNAEDVGNWYYVMAGMSWLAMLTNAALVTWTYGSFEQPAFGGYPNWIYFTFTLGCLVSLKVLLMLLIPDTPSRVKTAEEHHAWVLKQVEEDSGMGVRHRLPEEVDVAALDLSVDDANTGQWRDPHEFGLSTAKVKKRVSEIQRRKVRKGKPPPEFAVMELGAAGSGDFA